MLRVVRTSATKKYFTTLGQERLALGNNVLGSSREGGVTIPFPNSAKVRGGIVETVSKMFSSLHADRLFGVV